MNAQPSKQLNKEMLIFLSLAVINLLFSATFLAIGIVFIINNIWILSNYDSLFNTSVALIILGFLFSIIGFYWIVKSALMMDFITDIQWKIYWTKKKQSDSQITKSIIKLIAYYRENISQIKKMIFISIIGGIIFVIQSMYYILEMVLLYDPLYQWPFYQMRIISVILMLSWGILCFYTTNYIRSAASIWDIRLRKSREAEEIIRQRMESK